MANKNFRVRHGLEVDGNIAATDLTLSGNLTVNGTTTTINTDTLTVEDNIVVLNSNVTGTPTTDAGIEVERGDSTNSAITWKESDDKWYQNRGGTETVIAISTSELAEGTNEYFTQSRARQSVSVTDSGGDGSLSYDNSTGVFTYTGPSASEVRAHFSGGTGVTITDGVVAIGQAVATTDNVTFAGITAGNLTVGLTDNNAITSTDTNGNITLAPNGTGIVTVSTQTDTDLTDGNYVKGTLFGMRAGSFTVPSPLTTISGFNGFQAVSSSGGNGYTATVGINQFNGDTVAGVNSGGSVSFRNANGTNSAPTATTSGNVPGTIAFDGYATTGWAGSIATANSGGGTSNISPLQIQGYARENFADSAGVVTNAGMGFRVRGFPTATAMTVANRINFIDHNPVSASYRTQQLNIQDSVSTAVMANFNTTGATVRRTVTSGVPGVAENKSAFFIELTRSDQSTPATGDGPGLYHRTRGSNNTFYTLSDINASYSTTGDVALNFNLANGDQTTSTFSSVTPLRTSITATTIRAGTASATPGGSSVSDILQCNANNVIAYKPVRLNDNSIESSSGAQQIVTSSAAATLTLKGDAINLQTSGGTALTSAGIGYTRTYGEFAYTAGTITPAAADTVYAFPLDTTLNNNGVTISDTSRVNINVSGWYKVIMSLQVKNADNANDHLFRFWLRKNGADVAQSATLITPLKLQEQVVTMHWLVNSDGNDYWEIVYYVNDTDVTFPNYAAISSPVTSPQALPIIVNVIPAGA